MLSGCVGVQRPPKIAAFASNALDSSQIKSVGIYKALDFRVEKNFSPDAAEITTEYIARYLKKNKIKSPVYEEPMLAQLTFADLSACPPDWIKSLPQNNERWILIVGVDDFSKVKKRFLTGSDSTYRVSLACVLYDKQTGEKLWMDYGFGLEFSHNDLDVGQPSEGIIGHPIAKLFGDTKEEKALREAVVNLFESLLPKKN